MRLPTNVRPNPNQSLANRQWRNVFRSQYITADQGLHPRSIVGHPAQVAKAALFSQDVPYGDDPTRTGAMGTAWYAAMQARASETSQTLQVNGLEGLAYGRASGTMNRALRVRRMPVGAISLGSADPADLDGSGDSPWYKNPIVWAGVGVGAFVVYTFAK